MEIIIINQIPGAANNLLQELKAEFNENGLKEFKCLMAYTTWDGIDLLHEELENFYDKNGTSYSMIIGIGIEGKEIDTLRYFNDRMPNANIFVFNAANNNYIFHPKVYVFKKSTSTTIFIGSNNFSLGGFYQNSECIIKLVLNNKKNLDVINQINCIWESYRNPIPPFSSLNLLKLNSHLISKFEKHKPKPATKPKQSSTKVKTIKDLFPRVEIPPLNRGDSSALKSITKTNDDFKGNNGKKQALSNGNLLFMQVMSKETGAGGTQIQIPIEVLRSYFNVSNFSKNKTIQLKFSDVYRPAVICIFIQNSTFRISIPEIEGLTRPLILQFIRIEINKYEVSIFTGTRYKSELKKCINQTTNSSKKWVVV